MMYTLQTPKQIASRIVTKMFGGKGSGNFGHEGLDNVWGGSGGGGKGSKGGEITAQQAVKQGMSKEEFIKAQEGDILTKNYAYQDALREYNAKINATKQKIEEFITQEYKSSNNYGIKFINIKSGETNINEFPSKQHAIDAFKRYKTTLGKKIKDIELLNVKQVDEFNFTKKQENLIKELNIKRPNPEDFDIKTKSQLTKIWNEENK